MTLSQRARSLAVNVAVMAVAGWASAGVPFHGDQALFAMMARDMHSGAVLYHDVWDVTNPGVFWFYEVAGTCFGFSEDGIHLLEWLWWTSFVLTVSEAIRRQYDLSSYPLAPAVLLGAVYYLTSCSDPSRLTKAEGLVGFPLFLGVWCASRAVIPGVRPFPWLLAAGVAGGVAVLFKFLFGCCLAAAWLYLLWEYWKRPDRRSWLGVPAFVFALTLGVSLPLAGAVAYFAAVHHLGDAFTTLFITPRELMRVAHLAGTSRLLGSVRLFLEVDTPVLALAALGSILRLRAGRDPFVVATILQFAAATTVILVQRWSWWGYHFLLLAVPASVVASYTWPAVTGAIVERVGRPRTCSEWLTVVVPAMLLFLPTLGHGAISYMRLSGHHLGLTAEDRRDARANAGFAYREAVEETAWLESARPGPIFVCGDPLFYWLSGRPQATSVHGWSLELYDPGVWARLVAELEHRQPVYVFVARALHHYDSLIREKSPDFTALLARRYRPVRVSDRGVWYERGDGP